MKKYILGVLLISASFILNAQTSDAAFDQTKQEIEGALGVFPTFFEALPKQAVPGMWEYFKAVNNPNAAIPPKYRELMQLSVAAQIPCDYCIFFHTEAAKAYGASTEEVKEAILNGAVTRNWSMILQGNQVKLEDFKADYQKMMAHMAAQANKK